MFDPQKKVNWTPKEKAALDELQRQLMSKLDLKQESFGFVEPDVWIEYFRLIVGDPLMSWQEEFVANLPSMMPDGLRVQTRIEYDIQIWEYLM